MKNWRTSLVGLIGGLPLLIDALVQAYNSGYFTDKTGVQLWISIALIVLSLLAKDKNITGVGNDALTKKEVEDIGLPKPPIKK